MREEGWHEPCDTTLYDAWIIPEPEAECIRLSVVGAGRASSPVSHVKIMNPQLPLEEYIFVLSRLRYLSAAVTNIPTFKPDGQPAAVYTVLPPLCEQAYSALLTPFNQANVALNTMQTARTEGYDAAVTVYACMKSCYRTDASQARAIRSLPKSNSSPDRALARMRSTTDLWVTLPNVPGTNAPLTVGLLTAGAFGSMTTDFSAKLATANLKNSTYAGALAAFHDKLDGWNKLVSAAAAQGRALYKPGTPQRAIIDRIPIEPSTQKPVLAHITLAESPAAGTVHLLFGAEHATSFKVYRKGPGEPEFVEVADVLRPGEYTDTDLATGAYLYAVAGVNSQGAGARSVPAEVPVQAAQAA